MSVTMINDLRGRRASLLAEMREITEAAESADRDLTGEEQQEFDRREADFEAITGRIERMEKLGGLEATPATPDADPEEVRSGAPDAEVREAAFEQFLRSRGNLEALTGEQRAAMQVGTDSEGGFTVSDHFHKELVSSLRDFGGLYSLARKIRTGKGGEVSIPKVATHAAAAWTAEEAAFNASEPTFGQAKLGAHKATALAKASDELLHDSEFDIVGFVGKELGEAFALLEGAAYATAAANSTDKPKGLVPAATVGKTGAVAATAVITAEDLIDLFHSVKSGYRTRATWVFNDGTAASIRKIKGTDGQFLWQPGLQAGQPDVLLGRPVAIDPHIADIAVSAVSVVFGDIAAGYWIREVENVSIKVLNELYAGTGQVGIRGYRRVDGVLVDTEAVKTFKHGAAS